jgi:hypothetical protein
LSLIPILKELWQRRRIVAVATAAAALIAALAVFQVSLSPPSVGKRSQPEGRGTVEILVDSARSPIADARRDLTGLTARAGVFARYIAGGNVVGKIAQANDIPVQQIDVAGPTPLPGQAPGLDEAPEYHPYGIAVVQPDELLPIVSVQTRAPSVRGAHGLAAAVPAAVRQVVRTIQAEQGTMPGKRVEFRVLGPPRAVPEDDSLGKKAAALVFLVLLTIFLAGILLAPRLAAAWHAAEPDVAQPEDRPPRPVDLVQLSRRAEGDTRSERGPAQIGPWQE